jgi:histidinol-phosphate aminotransferase
MFDINKLIRKNIRSLIPYSSARDEYKGEEAMFLDANENPFNAPLNRYPDPKQRKLKNHIAEIKKVPAESIFLGNGSDEAIDLLIRAFCEPGVDNIISIKPTYGMYKVCADINNVAFREALLNHEYQPDTEALLNLTDENSKLLFLCSPNNPTSNSLNPKDVIFLIENFPGLVIVDEAYIDFCEDRSFSTDINLYPNLVVLQTFSKAWGMAGIRLGMAYAGTEIIDILTHIKYPYNINILTQTAALESLANTTKKDEWIGLIVSQREYLKKELMKIPLVKNILNSDANFLMVKFDQPQEIFSYLTSKKIIVRDRSRVSLCEGYLRFTIGSESENRLLIETLKELK